jgi:hypothetical protein
VAPVRPRASRARRNGAPARAEPGSERGPGRGAWLAPIIGATVIVTLAWAASLAQATPEIFVAASLMFALGEGLVLAFVGTVWCASGVPIAIGVSVLTAALATPGRWQLAELRTGQTPQLSDLLVDAAVTLAWAAFAGLAGATILRERLSTLLPHR